MTDSSLIEEEACRNKIGVWGDRSCPELVQYTHCRNCPVYAQAGRQLLDREAAPGYIEDWRTRIASVSPQNAAAQCAIVIFRVSGEWLALPTRLIREVVDPTPVHRIPHRQDQRFMGLVNVRGELMPCVSLCEMLSTSAEAEQNLRAWPRLLVLERDGAAWALPVDEVDGARRIPLESLRRPPVTVASGSPSFTASVFTITKGDVGLLDDDLLLLALRDVCR